MTKITVSRTIRAPKDVVFRTVADATLFAKAVPHVTRIDYLSDIKTGVGTRFRETRKMGNRESITELRVTEYAENEYVRLVADSHGTVWDSVFTIESTKDQKTRLILTMKAKPQKLLPRLLTPLFKKTMTRALADDMDAIKLFCEKAT
ncbi:hypothetical protein GF406_00820 [candidate division KSB1 bacterium]|nr:hypothetical protein [candidate division KSB1 bacterium]